MARARGPGRGKRQQKAAAAPPAEAEPVAAFEAFIEASGKAQQAFVETLLNAVPQGSELAAAWLDPFRLWTGAGRAALGAAPDADGRGFQKLAEDWWLDSLKLWSALVTGRPEDIPPAANRPDKRFGPAWSEVPVFDLIRRSYLLASHYLMETAGHVRDLAPELAERIRFQTRQVVEAMSPANFAALNPEVLKLAKETGGKSLVRGLENLARDIAQGKLTMTDETAFEVGRNVAATPGKVVFENRMFQLIQYAPTTATVSEIPLLIFPPWINKYYILDLTPEKSFIRWAVEQGLTVFVVSWAQGSPKTADATLATYVTEGYLTAIETVRALTKAPAVHAIGYCVAGTTLAITLAYLAARGEADVIRTATFFTAQVDFSEAGDLIHFVDDQMLATIEALGKDGVFDGRYLALTFNMLRPTDLIWSYVVNNYLMGKDYTPFDLLYWNSDPTNVPAKWHLDYVRDLYRDNLLVKPGGIHVGDTPIDLGRITTPAYVQAGADDHIAPAVSVYKLTHFLKGPVTFMLAGSGHIAGVINPPSAQKYMFWTLPEGEALPARLEDFRARAVETKGSWWPHWIGWLKPQSGGEVPARVPGTVPGFPAIEDAPGRYVKDRVA
ncbi:PHA/PHB synthase family protein [Thermaurantiacus sp.]